MAKKKSTKKKAGGGTKKKKKSEPAAEARKTVEDAKDVRERIRDTFVRAVQERHIDTEEVRSVTQQVLDGAVDGLKSAAPKEADSVLKSVVDGLADGFSSAANATRYALEEAKNRGEQFAKEDVDKAVQNLREMEELLVDTVKDTANRATTEIADQIKSLNEHTQRAASHVRPAIQDAIEAALKHPVKFAGEAASTGAKGVPRAAGHLLHAVSGLLEGAGDLLSGERSSSSKGKKS